MGINPGITYHEPINIGVPFDIEGAIEGGVSHIKSIEYEIENVLVSDDLTYNGIFQYTPNELKTYDVVQRIVFHDGFQLQTIEYEDEFIPLQPINFEIHDTDSTLTKIFRPDVEEVESSQYTWKVYKNSILISSLELSEPDDFIYSWPSNGNFLVKLEVDNIYGLNFHQKSITVEDWPGSASSGETRTVVLHRDVEKIIKIDKHKNVVIKIKKVKFKDHLIKIEESTKSTEIIKEIVKEIPIEINRKRISLSILGMDTVDHVKEIALKSL